MVFTLVGRVAHGSLHNYSSCWLFVAGCYYYYCLSNNQRWTCTKVEEAAGGLPLGWSTGRDRLLF